MEAKPVINASSIPLFSGHSQLELGLLRNYKPGRIYFQKTLFRGFFKGLKKKENINYQLKGQNGLFCKQGPTIFFFKSSTEYLISDTKSYPDFRERATGAYWGYMRFVFRYKWTGMRGLYSEGLRLEFCDVIESFPFNFRWARSWRTSRRIFRN